MTRDRFGRRLDEADIENLQRIHALTKVSTPKVEYSYTPSGTIDPRRLLTNRPPFRHVQYGHRLIINPLVWNYWLYLYLSEDIQEELEDHIHRMFHQVPVFMLVGSELKEMKSTQELICRLPNTQLPTPKEMKEALKRCPKTTSTTQEFGHNAAIRIQFSPSLYPPDVALYETDDPHAENYIYPVTTFSHLFLARDLFSVKDPDQREKVLATLDPHQYRVVELSISARDTHVLEVVTAEEKIVLFKQLFGKLTYINGLALADPAEFALYLPYIPKAALEKIEAVFMNSLKRDHKAHPTITSEKIGAALALLDKNKVTIHYAHDTNEKFFSGFKKNKLNSNAFESLDEERPISGDYSIEPLYDANKATLLEAWIKSTGISIYARSSGLTLHSIYEETFDIQLMDEITRAYADIESLDFTRLNFSTFNYQKNNAIQTLKLDSCHFTKNALESLFNAFPNLIKVEIENYYCETATALIDTFNSLPTEKLMPLLYLQLYDTFNRPFNLISTADLLRKTPELITLRLAGVLNEVEFKKTDILCPNLAELELTLRLKNIESLFSFLTIFPSRLRRILVSIEFTQEKSEENLLHINKSLRLFLKNKFPNLIVSKSLCENSRDIEVKKESEALSIYAHPSSGLSLDSYTYDPALPPEPPAGFRPNPAAAETFIPEQCREHIIDCHFLPDLPVTNTDLPLLGYVVINANTSGDEEKFTAIGKKFDEKMESETPLVLYDRDLFIYPNRPYALISPNGALLDIATSHPLELWYSEKLDSYVVLFVQNRHGLESIDVNDKPITVTTKILYLYDDIQYQLKDIDQEEELVVSDFIDSRGQVNIHQRIQKLPRSTVEAMVFRFIRSFTAGRLMKEPTSEAECRQLVMKYKKGNCQTRTVLALEIFAKLGHPYNKEFRGIYNNCHALLQGFQKGKWRPIETRTLNEVSELRRIADMDLSSDEKDEKKSTRSNTSSISVTQLSECFPGRTPLEFATAVKEKSKNTPIKMLVILPEANDQNNFCRHLIPYFEDIYFLYDLQEQSRIGGSFRAWVKQAKPGSVLLVSLEKMEREQNGITSLFERIYGDLTIPGYVHIIAMASLGRFHSFEIDLLSRFPRLDQGITTLPAWPVIKPKLTEPKVYRLYNRHSEFKNLFDRMTTEEGQLKITSSGSLDEKEHHDILLSAIPQSDEAKLFAETGFYERGEEWHRYTGNIQAIEEECKFNLICCLDEPNTRLKPFILHKKLLRYLKPHVQFRENNCPIILPSVLASLENGTQIIITSDLSAIQWAFIFHCVSEVNKKFYFTKTDNVTLPDALKKHVKNFEPTQTKIDDDQEMTTEEDKESPVEKNIRKAIQNQFCVMVTNDPSFIAAKLCHEEKNIVLFDLNDTTTSDMLIEKTTKKRKTHDDVTAVTFSLEKGAFLKTISNGDTALCQGADTKLQNLVAALFFPHPGLWYEGSFKLINKGKAIFLTQHQEDFPYIEKPYIEIKLADQLKLLRSIVKNNQFDVFEKIILQQNFSNDFQFEHLRALWNGFLRDPKKFIRQYHPFDHPESFQSDPPISFQNRPLALAEEIHTTEFNLLVLGETSSGKTTTVSKVKEALEKRSGQPVNMYTEDQIDEWSSPCLQNAYHIMIVDEASSTTLLNSLKSAFNQSQRHIINGLHERRALIRGHRIICIDNFLEENTDSENQPVYDLCLPMHFGILSFDERFNERIRPILKLFLHSSSEMEQVYVVMEELETKIKNLDQSARKMTDRNLEMMACYLGEFLSNRMRLQDAIVKAARIVEQDLLLSDGTREEKQINLSPELFRFFTQKGFALNQDHQRALQRLTLIAKNRQFCTPYPALSAGGIKGFLLGGPAGVGKSTLLSLFWQSQGYHLVNPGEKISIVLDEEKLNLSELSSIASKKVYIWNEREEKLYIANKLSRKRLLCTFKNEAALAAFATSSLITRLKMKKCEHELSNAELFDILRSTEDHREYKKAVCILKLNDFEFLMTVAERAVMLGWYVIFDEVDLFPFKKYLHAILAKMEAAIFPGFGFDCTFNGPHYPGRFKLSSAFINRFAYGSIERFTPDELTHALQLACPYLPKQVFEEFIEKYTDNDQLTPRCILEHGHILQARALVKTKMEIQGGKRRLQNLEKSPRLFKLVKYLPVDIDPDGDQEMKPRLSASAISS